MKIAGIFYICQPVNITSNAAGRTSFLVKSLRWGKPASIPQCAQRNYNICKGEAAWRERLYSRTPFRWMSGSSIRGGAIEIVLPSDSPAPTRVRHGLLAGKQGLDVFIRVWLEFLPGPDIPITVTHLSWRTVPANYVFLLYGKLGPKVLHNGHGSLESGGTDRFACAWNRQ
jgi:hypothetical protein